jgi:hypothetical protein
MVAAKVNPFCQLGKQCGPRSNVTLAARQRIKSESAHTSARAPPPSSRGKLGPNPPLPAYGERLSDLRCQCRRISAAVPRRTGSYDKLLSLSGVLKPELRRLEWGIQTISDSNSVWITNRVRNRSYWSPTQGNTISFTTSV